jgi:prepilin signal peptidase PulO-like enzyme (type II secretory pathway)
MLWGMSWFTLWNGLLLLVAPMVLAFLIAGFIILAGKKHLLYDLRIPFAPFIYLSYALALALTLIY